MTTTRTTCPYCGVGCGVEARVESGALIAVTGDKSHPANRGRLCVKGTALAESQRHQPLATQARIDGRAASWRSAVHEAARRFGEIIAQHGPDAVAFYLSGQLLTEDYYVANKLMKGFIGSGNVDTNSRLCMASAVAAHKRAFGEDVVPVSYDDLEAAELIVLVGSNTAWAHPVIYQRIAAARAARGTKVVVIDPRRTATCDIADLHLPLRPGSDVALFNYLLTWLDDQGHTDQAFVTAHTQGAQESLQSARADVANAAEHTGLSEATLKAFCELFATRRRTVTLFSQGVNQSDQGTDKANAIINCHLLTGRIGIEGAGPFSMTGQPNAMGGREVGGLATQLAAHMDFGAADRDRVQRFWQAPAVANGPGLKAVDLFDAMATGTVKAVWIMGTNPAVSLPNSGRIAQALARCPTVIVSDCATDTDTARHADIFLPALGWGEKDGTVTNSERVISRQRALRPATGTAQADWATVCEFARALGFRRGFNFESPAEIFREHAALSAFENAGDRQFDLGPLAALSDDDYDTLPPTRWPLNGPAFPEQRYSTASGRAQLVPVAQRPLASEAAGTFILNSGRLRDQWHTMTRTGHTPRLFSHTGRPTIALHPDDARALAVAEGQLLTLSSDQGVATLPLTVSADQRRGELFVPIHWSARFSGSAVINHLFNSRVDPVSGQPDSKRGAVAVQRQLVRRWLRALLPTDAAAPDRLDSPFQDAVATPAFWCRSAREDGQQGLEWAWAKDTAPASPTPGTPEDDWAAVFAALAADDYIIKSWERAGTRQTQVLLLRDDQVVGALACAPNFEQLPAWAELAKWRTDALAQAASWSAFGGEGAPADRSPVICTCHEVSRDTIAAAIASGTDSVEALGKALRCGTNCGSCVPELSAMLRSAEAPVELAATGTR